jgi:hypothetical protein
MTGTAPGRPQPTDLLGHGGTPPLPDALADDTA